MTRVMSTKLLAIAVAFGCTVIGYFAPITGIFVIVFLFILTVAMQAFSTAKATEVFENSRRVLKQMLVGEEGDWLRRAPWIGLLCGGALRTAHDLISGIGAA
jgi:hypothetical protein